MAAMLPCIVCEPMLPESGPKSAVVFGRPCDDLVMAKNISCGGAGGSASYAPVSMVCAP
jgi:hypothetical protein